MSWTETTHVDGDALVQALSASLGDIIRRAIEARGGAVLVLGGGRTPFPVYRLLAQIPLPWSKVALLCTDERWVPADHAARNERELAAAFAPARGVRILPLVPSAPDGDPEVRVAASSLAQLTGTFDLVLLGMGEDGHTASLFPGAAETAAGLDAQAPAALVVQPRPPPPEAPYPRVSLTLPRLLDTRRLLLLVRGEHKRAVLRQAQVDSGGGALPIAAFLHHPQARIEIHWSP